MNKPLVLKIIAWFFIISGGLTLADKLLTQNSAPSILLFCIFVSAVLRIIFGIGLLSVKKWAWFGVFIMILFSMGIQIFVLPFLGKDVSAKSLSAFLDLIINTGIAAYLLRKNIKEMFKIRMNIKLA